MDEDRSLDEVRGAHAQTLGLCCLRGLSPLHLLRAGGFLTPRNARSGDSPAPPTPPERTGAPRAPRTLPVASRVGFNGPALEKRGSASIIHGGGTFL